MSVLSYDMFYLLTCTLGAIHHSRVIRPPADRPIGASYQCRIGFWEYWVPSLWPARPPQARLAELHVSSWNNYLIDMNRAYVQHTTVQNSERERERETERAPTSHKWRYLPLFRILPAAASLQCEVTVGNFISILRYSVLLMTASY